MVAYGDWVQIIAAVAEILLLWGAALFFNFASPPSLAKRLFALFLAFNGFQIIVQFNIFFPSIAPVFGRYFFDLVSLIALAGVAFAWVYPEPPRLKSWAMLLLVFAAVHEIITAYLSVFAQGSTNPPADHPDAITMWGEFVYGWGARLAAFAMIGAMLLRTRGMSAAAKSGVAIVAIAMFADRFTRPGAYLLDLGAEVVGIDPPFHPFVFGEIVGDPLQLMLPLYLLTRLLVPAAFAVFLAVAWKVRMPIFFYVVGAVAEIPGYFGPVLPYGVAIVLTAIVPLYAVDRYGAFETRALPRGATRLLTASVALGVFVYVIALVLDAAPDSPYIAAIGVLVALVGALVAAFVTFPRAQGWASALAVRDASPAETGRRLDPYRVALSSALASGASEPEARERLRELRATLGVSAREHAVLAYALLAQGAPITARAWKPDDTILARYTLVRPLGAGGAGETWLAHDSSADRDVVVKRLRATSGAGAGVAAVLREARALARVHDPHVVTLLDVEEVGDEAFLIMEYVPGGSLKERIAGGPLGRDELRRVGDGLLDALDAIHGAALVHRDVKPSNVLLTRTGDAKLADFGIAHVSGFETTAGFAQTVEEAVGTVRYMSPEQARGRRTGRASDIWSAGATLFEAATGAPYVEMHAGESAMEMQIRVASMGAFDRARVPATLAAFFARALAPDPDGRFASAREMRDAWGAALS
ncbi:MAG: serine/threonine-protein kinase [Thermoplasmatota archaeon]